MINYRGTPLFGKDSSVSHTSEFFAIAGTVFFWLLFLIFSFVIKPQPKKPEYKEVQIVLESTPVVQKIEEAPAPAEAASESAASAQSEPSQTQPVVETPPAPAVKESLKSAPKKVETPKAQTKKEPAKTQTQPKTTPTQNITPTPIRKSNEELFEEQLRNKRTRNENHDPWANETDEETTNINDDRVVVNKANKLEGNAGNAASDNTGGKISSEEESNNKNDNITHSDKLDTIRDAKGIDSSNDDSGKSSEKSAGKDQNSVVWKDGSGARTYLKLDTDLSQKAKSSMQVSKDTPFTITFSVDPDGNVMATTIEIKNEFILSDIIKKEMKDKIASWKFGKGSGISKAQFDWILSPGN